MIDYRIDYDENAEAHDRHRRIVELMRMHGANQFGLIIAAVLLALALIMAAM